MPTHYTNLQVIYIWLFYRTPNYIYRLHINNVKRQCNIYRYICRVSQRKGESDVSFSSFESAKEVLLFTGVILVNDSNIRFHHLKMEDIEKRINCIFVFKFKFKKIYHHCKNESSH